LDKDILLQQLGTDVGAGPVPEAPDRFARLVDPLGSARDGNSAGMGIQILHLRGEAPGQGKVIRVQTGNEPSLGGSNRCLERESDSTRVWIPHDLDSFVAPPGVVRWKVDAIEKQHQFEGDSRLPKDGLDRQGKPFVQRIRRYDH
jgi:hypothetical protein